jgi:aminopeptidase N
VIGNIPRLAAAALLLMAATTVAGATPALGTEAPAGTRATADPPDPYFPNLGNRGYDVDHYDLGLRFETPAGLEGDTKITATAQDALRKFNLDLVDLDVQSVTVDGTPARFRRIGAELVVQPKQPIAGGEQFDVRIKYSGDPKAGSIPGIPAPNGWVPTDDGVITLNEPDGASRVFPSNDHPTDKASYTFRLDVPSSKTAIANGDLTSRTEKGDRTTFVWEQGAPMATYLTQLAVGDLTIDDQPAVDGVAIRNAYGPEVRDKAAKAAERTPEMLQFFTQWFGKFPFSTYGVLAPNHGPSGIAFEAQTFSLFGPDMFYDPELASVVLAHELSHQWFGDWVSPASWDETWLNEGFATYAEWLWSDHALGIPMSTNVEDALVHAQGYPGAAAADPGRDAMFDHAVYERGALTLHALRLTVGDEKFAEILHRYLEEYGGKTATTKDLVDIASDVAGQDLGDFFEQWLGPGKVPELPQAPAPVGSTPPSTAAPAPTA